jgi:hypothetical protein
VHTFHFVLVDAGQDELIFGDRLRVAFRGLASRVTVSATLKHFGTALFEFVDREIALDEAARLHSNIKSVRETKRRREDQRRTYRAGVALGGERLDR